MIMSIVCPLKFQPTLDGSCGTRMQMGTSSGLGSMAMKSDSESVSFCEGGGGATAIPGGAGKPGGGMGIALDGAGSTGASSVLSLFAGGSPGGTAGGTIAC
mmetsp:Transcript_35068/g.64963  ORF Transcript_35068/g.64963 Transcript_35068/m.64963 type:complete len:101 (+) Transcript_35068:169-471(+)